MATIRKRNGKYQVQVRTKGCSASRTFSQLSLARKWACDTELQAERACFDNEQHVPKDLSEILQRYMCEVTPRKSDPEPELYVLDAMMRADLAHIPINRLRVSDFAQYRDARLKQVKPSTLRRQIGILRAACRVARDEWNWASPIDLLQRITLPRVNVRYVDRLSPEDETALLLAAGKMANRILHDTLVLAVETGMRRSEILRLKIEDVDLTRAVIILRNTKNGHPRLIPISKRARAVLVPEDENELAPVYRATKDGLKSAFRRVRVVAGLPHLRFHDLRHEAISRLFEKGLTVPEVASISGHRDLSTLMRYAHADLKAAQDKINRVSL